MIKAQRSGSGVDIPLTVRDYISTCILMKIPASTWNVKDKKLVINPRKYRVRVTQQIFYSSSSSTINVVMILSLNEDAKKYDRIGLLSSLVPPSPPPQDNRLYLHSFVSRCSHHHTISSPFFSEVPASFPELENFYKRANIMHKIWWHILFVSIKYPLFYTDTQSISEICPKCPQSLLNGHSARSQKTRIVNIEYLGRVKSSLLK